MNNITIELCKEDRDRLDILNKALAMLTGQLEGINAALEAKGIIETVVTEEVIHVPGQVSIDELVAQEPQEAPEPVEEVQPLPITVTVLDEPVECDTAAPVPSVTKQDILAKVIELCGKGKKAEAKDVITTYADSVSDLPDSALVEVWDKLVALEG